MYRVPVAAGSVRAVLVFAVALGSVAAFAQDADKDKKKSDAPRLLFGDKEGKTKVKTRSFASSEDKNNDSVSVWIDDCKTKEVKFEETERSTRIASDIQALLKQIAGPKAAAAPVPCPNPVEKTQTLGHKRASVKVTATGKEDGAQETVTILTGPPEHWYMAVDLPGTNSKTLKYDSGTKQLVPQGTGHQLYISVNYYLGDVLAPLDTPAYGRFSGKLLVAAQSKPFDSVGLGLGYRLPNISALNWDLSSFEMFVGRFWTKQDAVNGTDPQLNSGTARSWRVGVSYNFDDGLKFLKK
jgi:hypothetical protein